MPLILTTCPNSGTTVSTGQFATSEEFDTAPDLSGTFRCSYCKEVHSWIKEDSRLAPWAWGRPPRWALISRIADEIAVMERYL